MPEIINRHNRRFDWHNRHWSRDSRVNLLFLQAQENYANDLLKARGYVFLNDIQEMLGYERTANGQLVGWHTDNGNEIDFHIAEAEDEPGAYLLEFVSDGVIYDKLP